MLKEFSFITGRLPPLDKFWEAVMRSLMPTKAGFQLSTSVANPASPSARRRCGWLLLFLLLGVLGFPGDALASGGHSTNDPVATFPVPLENYGPLEAAKAAELGRSLSMWETLLVRAQADPFNVIASAVFLLAILHTFLCTKFNKLAHHFEVLHEQKIKRSGKQYPAGGAPVSFRATVLHFLGEVEAVFGIWLVPLFVFAFFYPGHGWTDAVSYLDSRNFTEAVFVVVIMAIASTRPVVFFAHTCLRSVALLGRGTPAAWWLTVLIIAPLLGSFITEPAAMTIAALLLGEQFYRLQPSMRLRYATLGLLFVNISVGGTLTHFAAPPVLMVSTVWHWNLPFMFSEFGWRAALGIVISTFLYAWFFRKELFALRNNESDARQREIQDAREPVPAWVIIVHLCFLAWTVVTLHHPAFFVFAFLFFLAFTHATRHFQYEMALRGPVLVGFFLGSLVVHGGLQGWWISVLLANLSENLLFVTVTILTAFNDNAAITYLATQVPAFNPDVLVNGHMVAREGLDLARAHALEYAVMAGAVTGGGLTVIANAPNPAGQSLLSRYFGSCGISPLGLLAAALIPTLIMAACFMLIP